MENGHKTEDDKLRAELLSILNQSLASDQPSSAARTATQPIEPPIGRTKAEQYSIEEQIAQLRKQLTESYSIFMNARDALSSISFVGIDEKLKRESNQLMGKIDQQTVLVAEQPKDFMFDANVQKVGNIDELNTFFRVVKQLDNGIRNMERNHKLMADLNEDVADAVYVDNQYVRTVKETLSKTASMETIRMAEDLVNLQMKE